MQHSLQRLPRGSSRARVALLSCALGTALVLSPHWPVYASDSPPAEAAAEAAQALRVEIVKGRVTTELRVDPATGASTPLAADSVERIALPGTDLAAELVGDRHRPRSLSVVQLDAAGNVTSRTEVCPAEENPRDVAWHVGWHRLVYIRGVHDAASLRSRDPRSDHEATMNLGGAVSSMRVGPDDQIAALVVTGRTGKIRDCDLVVVRGRATLRPVTTTSISSFAWMPDGKSLIYSVPGEIRIHGIDGGLQQTIKLGTLEANMWNHMSRSMDVHPDGTTVALALCFAGGTASGFGEPEPPPARELFILELPDRLRLVPVEGTVISVRWMSN